MDLGNGETSTLKRRRPEVSTEGGGHMILVDRISYLPEAIISHILSLLPTKSAVATSFLSKSWRLRWTKIIAFDFEDQLWPDSERSEPETRSSIVPAMNFVEFVNLVFANHTEFIHKLRLQWQLRNIRSVYLNIWLNAAVSRKIRVLDLATVPDMLTGDPDADDDYGFDLPAALYTSETLETVKLRGPFRIKLPQVVRLPKVAVLELLFVDYERDESVEKLISACPLLQSLKMERSHHRDGLLWFKVFSPSLKRFEISFHDDILSDYPCELKLVIDTPSLEHLVIDSDVFHDVTCVQQVMPVNEVGLDLICDDEFSPVDTVARLLQACAGAKVMRIAAMASLDLSQCCHVRLPANFGRLTKLVLGISHRFWSKMLDLIDRCINLEVLDITDIHCRERCRQPPRVPGCLSSSLKHVYFRSFTGFESDMTLLKYLLDHGLLLERVVLSSSYSFTRFSETKKMNILNEVLMLSRASATCKVSFSFQ